MAQTEPTDSDDLISGINVTPLVDVVLVLLVILMVTATYVLARGIPLELPKASTGESDSSPLVVSIEPDGDLYVDTERVDENGLRRRVRAAVATDPELRAILAADAQVSHGRVVRVMDLLRAERVHRFAINVSPEELGR
jgi:biopolymer transport protein ExbD